MTLELACRAEVLGIDDDGASVATLSWQPKPQPSARATRRPPTICQRHAQAAALPRALRPKPQHRNGHPHK